MPSKQGSVSFLGAARFQGFWDASDNSAEGSGLPGAPSGSHSAIFDASSPTSGYYAMATQAPSGLQAAQPGDYWQVTKAGSTNVDGQTSWAEKDWIIYSGSAGAGYTWRKLAYDDTISSIVVGDINGGGALNELLLASQLGVSPTVSAFNAGQALLMRKTNNAMEVPEEVLKSIAGSSVLQVANAGMDRTTFLTSGSLTASLILSGGLDTRSNHVASTFLTGTMGANIFANPRAVQGHARLCGDYNGIMWGPVWVPEGRTLTVCEGAYLKIKDISDL